MYNKYRLNNNVNYVNRNINYQKRNINFQTKRVNNQQKNINYNQNYIFNVNNFINTNINFSDLNNIYENKKRISITDFLDQKYAYILYKKIIKLPLSSWYNVCGIENTKYEKRIIPQNFKNNRFNVEKAKETFGKNKFSFNFHRTMCKEKVINTDENILRNLLTHRDFMDIIESITNVKITRLNQVFVSKYKSGHFLAPHSDINNGSIAFVINLSLNWKPEYGGVLHFLSEDRTNIIDSYVPKFNSMMLFTIPKGGIPHFVSHVSPNVKNSRIAITGWYE